MRNAPAKSAFWWGDRTGSAARAFGAAVRLRVPVLFLGAALRLVVVVFLRLLAGFALVVVFFLVEVVAFLAAGFFVEVDVFLRLVPPRVADFDATLRFLRIGRFLLLLLVDDFFLAIAQMFLYFIIIA